MGIIESLKTYTTKNGILGWVFDADNTLFETSPKFSTHIENAATILGVRRQLIDDCVVGTRNEFKVNPIIVHHAVMIAAKQVGYGMDDELTQKALVEIDKIYTEKTDLFEGVVELLGLLMNTQAHLYLATHATDEYTQNKIRHAGLYGRFKEIFTFDVLRPKSEQWMDFYQKTNLEPSATMVVGDDFFADIAKPASLGAWTCWVNNGLGKTFSPESITESGTPRHKPIELDHIQNFATALIASVK
jgi:FMN phosphatase YigB (HAD superfamily)